jgi:predicted transcriptional regulator
MNEYLADLGRRERQIMDILYRRERATAAQILGDLPDPPSYSAVRAMLRLLENKGHVEHEWSGPRHVYRPTADLDAVKRSAARHLLHTFFDGSMASAVSAMLGAAEKPPSPEDLERLGEIVDEALREGGRS